MKAKQNSARKFTTYTHHVNTSDGIKISLDATHAYNIYIYLTIGFYIFETENIYTVLKSD